MRLVGLLRRVVAVAWDRRCVPELLYMRAVQLSLCADNQPAPGDGA